MSDTSKSPDAPQAYHIAACAFIPPLALPVNLFKKITHPYPLRFLLPCRSALWLPHPGRGHTLPSLLPRAPSAAARSRPVASASCPPPITCADAGGAHSARCMPPAQPT
jgi:hypothetical protein